MSEPIARSILRLFAVATIVIGAIMTVQVVVGLMGMIGSVSFSFGMAPPAHPGVATLVSALAPFVIGVLLFAMSPTIARWVVE
jgi:hypothetical protein